LGEIPGVRVAKKMLCKALWKKKKREGLVCKRGGLRGKRKNQEKDGAGPKNYPAPNEGSSIKNDPLSNKRKGGREGGEKKSIIKKKNHRKRKGGGGGLEEGDIWFGDSKERKAGRGGKTGLK